MEEEEREEEGSEAASTPVSTPHPTLSRLIARSTPTHSHPRRRLESPRALKTLNFTRPRPKTPNGVPSAVWHKQFAGVAYTFQPGSERRRVRGTAPSRSEMLPRESWEEVSLLANSASNGGRHRHRQWPLDGRLSTNTRAYNDGEPWTRSPCIARQVREEAARDRARKPDPHWTFTPDMSMTMRAKHAVKEQRPEDIFNKYTIHRYTHFDRHLMYSIEPSRFTAKATTGYLANVRHAWRGEVEAKAGKDGRGRAYGRALWEAGTRMRQRRTDEQDELLAVSLVGADPVTCPPDCSTAKAP